MARLIPRRKIYISRKLQDKQQRRSKIRRILLISFCIIISKFGFDFYILNKLPSKEIRLKIRFFVEFLLRYKNIALYTGVYKSTSLEILSLGANI